MPTPTVDSDTRQGAVDQTQGMCGHQWTGDAACDAGSEHQCSRVNPEHRSHLCTCQAVELRTATHLPMGTSRPASAGPDEPWMTTVDTPRPR